MHKGINTTVDEGQTPIVTTGGVFDVEGVDFQNCVSTGSVVGTLMGEAMKKGGETRMGVLAFTGDGATADPISASEGKTYAHEGAGNFRLRNCVGTPVSFRADAMREGVAKTPSADAEGRVRLRDPGMGMYEDIAPMLDTGAAHGVAYAFSAKDHGGDATVECSPTLCSGAHSDSHANGGVMPAVAFHENQRAELSMSDTAGAIKQGGGKPGQGYRAVMQSMQVRRLTPVECARLQGFPDDYLDITFRGKPAADGPKYRALGNSWATPVVRWIGQRIEAVEGIAP